MNCSTKTSSITMDMISVSSKNEVVIRVKQVSVQKNINAKLITSIINAQALNFLYVNFKLFTQFFY